MKCSHLPFEVGVPVPCRQTRKLSPAGDGTCCSLAAGTRAELTRLCRLYSWSQVKMKRILRVFISLFMHGDFPVPTMGPRVSRKGSPGSVTPPPLPLEGVWCGLQALALNLPLLWSHCARCDGALVGAASGPTHLPVFGVNSSTNCCRKAWGWGPEGLKH